MDIWSVFAIYSNKNVFFLNAESILGTQASAEPFPEWGKFLGNFSKGPKTQEKHSKQPKITTFSDKDP